MKNLLLCIVALSIFSLGCSDESSMPDDTPMPEEPSLSTSIIGMWTMQSMEIECIDQVYNVPVMTIDENGCVTIDEEETCNFSFTFLADNLVKISITQNDNTSSADLTYTVDDTNNTFEFCFSDGSEEICESYEVTDDTFDYIQDEGDCKAIYGFIKS